MPEFDEELLSAYLDGELPDDERARVEQWLTEQPESKQLLEELRSLKTSLERLPRERLPRDFAEDVLRRAEREVLTSRDHAVADEARRVGVISKADRAEPLDGEHSPERMADWSWQRLRRPVVWASLTLAAGLLLMFLDRDRLQPAAHRQVAQAPAEAPPLPRGEIGASPADKLSEDRGLRRGTDPESAPSAAPAAPAGPASALAADNEPPPPANRAPRGAAEPQAGSFGARMAGAKARGGETADEPMEEDARRSSEAKDALQRAFLGAQLQRRAPIAADQTLVVWCDVSPGKEYNERFRQLLVSNSIQWSEEGESAGAAALSDAVPDVAEKSGEADKKAPAPPAKPRNEAAPPGQATGRSARPAGVGGGDAYFYFERSDGQNARRLMEAGQAAMESKAELVVVEASEPQIAAVLDGLDRDEDVFKTVDVEPAAEVPSQQSFERYRRGNTRANQLAKQRAPIRAKKETQEGEALGRSSKAAAEKKRDARAGVAYRLTPVLNQLTTEQENAKADETTNAPAAAEEGRVQVLFVLHPVEDNPPAEPTAEKKDPKDD